MTEKLNELTKKLEVIVKQIVDFPEEVCVHTKNVNSDIHGNYILFCIKVNEMDIPVCIGKGGNTVRSLNALFFIMSSKLDIEHKLSIKIDVGKD